jgi:hypothetical protein
MNCKHRLERERNVYDLLARAGKERKVYKLLARAGKRKERV